MRTRSDSNARAVATVKLFDVANAGLRCALGDALFAVLRGLRGYKMGFVVAKIKIMPKDMESFEDLKASLKGQVEVMEEELIAFGMKALLVLFKMEDEGGAQDKIEEKLRSNPLVSSYEVMSVGRI